MAARKREFVVEQKQSVQRCRRDMPLRTTFRGFVWAVEQALHRRWMASLLEQVQVAAVGLLANFERLAQSSNARPADAAFEQAGDGELHIAQDFSFDTMAWKIA